MLALGPAGRSVGARVCAAALLIGALAVGATPSSALAGEAKPKKTDVLFVVEGQQAWTVTRADGAVELTIAGVEPDVLFFSDRPSRTAGTVSSADLFEGWDSLDFGRDPPNAAVVMQDGPKGRRPTAVELGEPRYEAATSTVRFPLSALSGQEASWLRALTEDRAGTHGTIDLFIDTSPVDIRFVNDSRTDLCVLVFQPPPDAKPCK